MRLQTSHGTMVSLVTSYDDNLLECGHCGKKPVGTAHFVQCDELKHRKTEVHEAYDLWLAAGTEPMACWRFVGR
jgi:hypothetical protein